MDLNQGIIHTNTQHTSTPPLTHTLYLCISTIASPGLPKFAEMLLENNVAFITP